MLDCNDALRLCEAIKPVQETAAMVPRLQRFADEICWVGGAGWVGQEAMAVQRAAL